MKKNKRKLYLERILHSLKVCHIDQIEEAFEGSFKEGKVLPACLIFNTNRNALVNSAKDYISQEFFKYGFRTQFDVTLLYSNDNPYRYEFRIMNPGELSLEDYEKETTQILHIIPRILDDFSHKNPRR